MFLYLALESDPEGSQNNSEGDSGAETGDATETEQTETTPATFEIDGEQFTIDQIKEWRLGNMRQSDYTRKSQEIARMRREAQEAIELYEYLRRNPDLVQKLSEEATDAPEVRNISVDPVVQELDMKVRTMEIEKSLSQIKSEFPEANDIEILQIATDRRISIEDAFDIWKGMNLDKFLKQKSTELAKKMTTNKEATKTLMNPNMKPPINNLGLSQAEIAFAQKLDMTPEEYKKYKNYKR